MDFAQRLWTIDFPNPTVPASGIWGITASSWRAVAHHGAGAVTTKSIWLREHHGHKNPTIISTDHWTLNAVGLPDAGIEKAQKEIGSFLLEKPVPLIASIVAGTIDDFAETAAAISALQPDLLEINISCPNVHDEFGTPFACSASDAARVTKAVKAVSGALPITIKLSPNVADIGAIALRCAEAGADGFTAINTVGPGMAIDLRSRLPILTNRTGGLSGRAIKPIAVRCIADIYAATEGKLPIIGMGGVYTGEDALELMMAGASLIGIGTAIMTGANVFQRVCEEMSHWCTAEGIDAVYDLVGAMHRTLRTSAH